MQIKEIQEEERKEVARLYKSNEARIDELVYRKYRILQLEEQIKDLKAELRYNKHWPFAVGAITITISVLAFIYALGYPIILHKWPLG